MYRLLMSNNLLNREFKEQIELMKTALFGAIITAFILGSALPVFAQGWTQLDDFPSSSRDDGTSFTIGSITYCGTGLNSAWTPTNDFFALDMTSDMWSPITGLPAIEARQYSNGFSSASHGYLFGGLNTSGYLSDVWKYDPVADTWTEVTPMPSVGRSGASCFVIGDTAYILGGQTQANLAFDEVWAYSMSGDSWTQKNSTPDSLWRASAIAYQGKGYLFFGVANNGIYKNKLYEYSPLTDSWAPLSDFPGVGRTYVGTSILNNELVIFAGRDSIGNSYNDMWNYSVASDSWSLSVNLPSNQRRGGICFSSNTAIYYSTGIDLNDVRLTETWKYDLFLGTNDEKLDEFSIYPNPSKGFLRINSEKYTGAIEYRIISIDGTSVQSGKAEVQEEIQLKELKPGHYLIMIQSESNTTVKKIVIY